MATKPNSAKVNKQIEEALGEGLDFDFDLDMADNAPASGKSSADLEAQISRATDELVEAGNKEKEPSKKAAKAKKAPEPAKPALANPTEAPPRPIESAQTSAVSGLSPANDPDGSSRARIMQILNTKAPSTAYWLAGAASIAWLAGSAYVANTLYGPEVLTIEGFTAHPNMMAMIAAAGIPVALFFTLAALVRRGQEMRIATRSMAEVALQLTEPEVKMQNRIMTVSQAIRREVASLDEGIERTLDRAVDLESRVHTEVHELERSYSNNEDRIRNLLENLGREREAIVEHAERVRESIIGVNDELRGQLDGASNNMRDNISSATREISTNLHDIAGDLIGRIAEQSSQFRSLFDENASNFTTKMEDTGASFIKIMDERADLALGAFNSATDRVGANIEEKVDTLKDRLAASGQELLAEFETRTHAAEETAERFTSALDSRTQKINETLLERTQELSSSLSTAHTGISETIDSGRKAMRDDIDAYAERTTSLVDEQTMRVANALKGNTDALSEVFGTGQMAMEMAFAQNHSRFNEELDALINASAAQFEERSVTLTSNFHSAREASAAQFEAQTAALADKFGEISSATTSGLAENIDRLDAVFNTHRDAVEGRATRMEGTLSATSEALEQSAKNQASILREALQQTAESVNSMYGEHRQGIENQTAQMAEKLAEAGASLEAVINRQNSTLDERGKAMHDMLSATNETLISAFESQNATVTERAASVTADIKSATQSLEHALASQAGTLEERTQRLEGEIANATNALNAAFESQSGQITERARAFEETLQSKIYEISDQTTQLQDEVGRATGKLNAAFEAQSGIIEERTAAMQGSLEKGVGNIRGTLENAAQTVADKLRSGVKDAATTLTDEAQRATSEIAEASVKIQERLDGSIENANNRLTTTGDALAERLTNSMSEANAQLALQANAVQSAVGEAQNAAERLKSSAEQGAELLSSTAEGIEGRVNQTVNIAGERLAEKGAAITTNLQAINARIDDQVREASDKLESAAANAAERLKSENAALVGALQARTQQSIAEMTATENALGAGVTDLLDRLSSSNAKLGSIIDMATNNLGDVSHLLNSTTDKFAEQTSSTVDRLASSAHLVDGSIGRLSDLSSTTLNEVAAIANRFDEHGRVLSSATELLASAQNNLTGTLKERKEALEQLSTGLINRSAEIEQSMGNFERLIQSTLAQADDKTRNTTALMQSAIHEAIEQSTDRFMKASMELRDSAQSIRADLAATRDDLERGVLELPEETRKSTGALRRAVGDQISALQELSNIVGSSRSAMAVSTPEDRPAQRAPQQSAPAFASSLTPPRQESPRPVAPPPAVPAPAPQTQMAQPAAAPSSGNDSWVGGLLRRASTDEKPQQPARSPLHVVDSLNSLSVDIARAIDHNASVELWDRYARGERDVFTRRLYTLRGQRTFDDIRQKYAVEREFREAVTRYCEDFEKLLGDVSKSDPTGQKTREYLTSDTGKVYTMLAHASGRLN